MNISFRVKDLIEKLKEFDENLPLVVTRCGKDHQYGIIADDVFVVDGACLGNDKVAELDFKHDTKFLNIAQI
jgi:hypothetical protein